MLYDELKIRIEPTGDGAYRVAVSGATGEATGRFELPFSELELENFVLRLSRTRRGTRRLESPEMQRARDFGGRLFDSVFQARVRDVFRDCYATARNEGKGLRLKVSLSSAPELTSLPWEYLYDDPAFLSISQFTPVVRYLDLPRARPPLRIEPPLRILAMVSAPLDAIPLDVQQEREKLELALQERGLLDAGLVKIRWLENATLRALQRELREDTFHIFHYIGHGGYDEEHDESVLLFEDEQNRGRRVGGVQLATILADHTSLRLAVLNACEGARTSYDDPFSGVAAALVQREVPAVIAMQFEITDRAAIIFAEELYYALIVDRLPVDAALAEARKSIFADGNDIEWGTPVLFMRVPDGRIFNVIETAGARRLLDLVEGREASEAELDAASEPPSRPPVADEPAPPASTEGARVADAPLERAHEQELAEPAPHVEAELPVDEPSVPDAPALERDEVTEPQSGTDARLERVEEQALAEPAPPVEAKLPVDEPSVPDAPALEREEETKPQSVTPLRRVGLRRRVFAGLTDGLVVAVLWLIIRDRFDADLVLLLALAYFACLEGRASGQTLGKLAFGIRVAELGTGRPIGYRRAAVRSLGRIVSAIPLCVGYFWMIRDAQDQTWHDKLAGSVVVAGDRANRRKRAPS